MKRIAIARALPPQPEQPQSGLTTLGEALGDFIVTGSVTGRTPAKTKPTYEEIETAFQRWENLLWNGASSGKVKRAEQTFDKLVDAFLAPTSLKTYDRRNGPDQCGSAANEGRRDRCPIQG